MLLKQNLTIKIQGVRTGNKFKIRLDVEYNIYEEGRDDIIVMLHW